MKEARTSYEKPKVDPSEPSVATRSRPARLLRRFGPLTLLLLAVVTAYGLGLNRYITLAAIAAHREALKGFVGDHLFLAGFAYVAVYIAVVALSLPGAALLTVFGGFLFGWLIGPPLAVIGATIGGSIVFVIARSAVGDAVVRHGGAVVRKIAHGFADDAFSYLLFLRLVPLFPFFAVNIAAALINLKLRTFVLATVIGIIPGSVAYSMLGSGLDSIIDAQKAAYDGCVAAKGAQNCTLTFDAHAVITPRLVVAFVTLGIVSLIPLLIRHWKVRKAPGENG